MRQIGNWRQEMLFDLLHHRLADVDKLRGGGDGQRHQHQYEEEAPRWFFDAGFRHVELTPFFATILATPKKLFPTTRYPWSVPADCLRLPDAAPIAHATPASVLQLA